jgi:predicted phage terminase large subunit-like protein
MPNRDRDLLIAILHEDFLAFVARAFDEVEPRVNLAVENYIRLLAHELTALAAGDTKRLILNLPPRHLKSLLTSVFLPAWMLGRDPRLRFIIVSHQMDLATLFSRLIRQIIASDWYAEVFPRTRLSPDHNTASEFITTVGGSVRATSINAGVTGHGADVIIVDDPLDANDATSEAARTNVIAFFNQALISRLDDPKSGRIVVVAQRLHDEDLPGHLLRSDVWKHVCLPFIATEDTNYEIGNTLWHRSIGDVLSPARFGPNEIAATREDVPSHVYATQWQQQPTAATSHWVSESDFPRAPSMPPNYSRCIMSWDPALKSGSRSDYSACVIAREVQHRLFIVNVWRGREDFEGLCRVGDRLADVWKPTHILTEDTALGPALAEHFARIGHRVFQVGTKGRPKADRFQANLARLKAGDVVLCEPAPWASVFIDEIVRFPYHAFDDQVDALIQLLTWTRENPPPPPRIIASGLGSRPRQPHPMRDPKNFMRPRLR